MAALALLLAGCASQQGRPAGPDVIGPAQSPAGASAAVSAHPSGAATSTSPAPSAPRSDPLQQAAQRLSRTTPSRLPDQPATAGALLARLPPSLAGAKRAASGPKEVSWTDGSTVTAAPLAEAAAPGQAMRDFFNKFADSGQFTITSRSAPTDRLLWFIGTTTDAASRPVAAVASADGHWLYGIEAANPPSLLELANSWSTLVG